MPPRTRTPAPTEPPAQDQAAPEPSRAPEPDPGGWFRNTGQVELTVLGEGATVVLAPGRITPLTRTPTHRDLSAATEADYRAQIAADEAAAKAAATPQPEDAARPTTEKTEA